MKTKVALAMVASVLLMGCDLAPARLTIRTNPDPNACPAAALPAPMRFRIDPHAQEQVLVIAPDGRTFQVFWAPGFVAGEVTDPVVRAPDGEIVARDGEIVEGPLLHGYTVCAGDAIYVLLV